MSVAGDILEYVQLTKNATREAIISEVERTHDPKVVYSTLSTMIRRGELKELSNGNIALGSEEEIEKARKEREQRKQERDRPKMPPQAQVAPVPSKPRLGSTQAALTIAQRIQALVTERGPLTANEIAAHVPGLVGNNVYHHCKSMVERGELIKRGREYAVSETQFERTEAPTAPIVNVTQAVAEAKELSQPEPPASPDTTVESAVAAITGKPAAPKQPPKAPDPNARAFPNADDISRIKSIADIARKHAHAAPEEHVLQLGDIYIAVTAPATVATRVLSAALAVLGAQP